MKLIAILLTGFLLATSQANLIQVFFNKAFDQIRPKLKNLQIDKFTFQTLELSNLAIQGLNEFYATTLNAQVFPLTINNLTIQVDDVQAQSSYKMEPTTIQNLITIFGKGDLEISIRGITLFIKALLDSKNKKIRIKKLEKINLHVDDLNMKITGLGGGGPVCDFLNQLINLVGTRVVNILAESKLFENRDKLVPYINKMLSQIKV